MAIETVPEEVIGPPVNPVPVKTVQTVPGAGFAVMPTIWPRALMSRVGRVYVPAGTPVGARAMVPVLVIVPPVNPTPAVIEVTLPDGETALIVPRAGSMLMLIPAIRGPVGPFTNHEGTE